MKENKEYLTRCKIGKIVYDYESNEITYSELENKIIAIIFNQQKQEDDDIPANPT